MSARPAPHRLPRLLSHESFILLYSSLRLGAEYWLPLEYASKEEIKARFIFLAEARTLRVVSRFFLDWRPSEKPMEGVASLLKISRNTGVSRETELLRSLCQECEGNKRDLS